MHLNTFQIKDVNLIMRERGNVTADIKVDDEFWTMKYEGVVNVSIDRDETNNLTITITKND